MAEGTMAQYLSPPAAHDHSAPPLVARDLAVCFDGTWALSQVSFTLPSGSRAAVVGPNGAGKTTLLKVISGALRPSTGEISVYGHLPGGHICIAYVPQRSQVDWSFPVSVAEVVMMGRVRKIGLLRWPRRADWEWVEQALDRVGMLAQRERRIGELSGGQQQRVFLAQALAQEAELVLLDEPLTGLDMPSQEGILALLDDLRRGGVTVMVATHDLNLASERFDHVLLLNRRLIAFGAPAQVLTPQHLMQAYGGHAHVLPQEGGLLVLTDTCCEGDEGPG